MIAETISIPGHNGDMIQAYYARPVTSTPVPGVIVLHHMPGWDEWSKEVARKLAYHGYAAICPHLFDRFGPGAPDDVAAAARAAEFLLEELRDERGRLRRTWKDGRARLDGYLEDHAYAVEALLTLYEATFDARWFHAARELADTTIERFGDAERGGFFTTARDHERLIARRKDVEDTPIPSGASAIAYGLLRLSALTGEARYEEAALGVLRPLGGAVARFPQAFGHALQAMAFHLGPVREVALAGDDVAELAAVVRSRYRPRVVLAGGDEGVPLMEGRAPVGEEPAAYVCEHFACQAPVTTARDLAALLD
jgi:uncharacterized protein YyaL (SSP411 family)